jgi:hypothetical protein
MTKNELQHRVIKKTRFTRIYFDKARYNKSAPPSSCQSTAGGYARINLLDYKIGLFSTAFLILKPASTWAGLVASNFLFGYLRFWPIQ